jgi:Fe-S-cluster containining protein
MAFKCKDNCADCCGVIPISKELLEKHKDKYQAPITDRGTFNVDSEVLVTNDGLCVFLDRKAKRCLIYDERPKVCRDFGVVDDWRLGCPHFKPNGNPRSANQIKQLERKLKANTALALSILQGKS